MAEKIALGSSVVRKGTTDPIGIVSEIIDHWTSLRPTRACVVWHWKAWRPKGAREVTTIRVSRLEIYQADV